MFGQKALWVINVYMCDDQDLLQRAELEAELSGFCLKFGFDLLLMMTISFSESQEPIRELAVFSHSATCREEVKAANAQSAPSCRTDGWRPPQVGRHLERARQPALHLRPISSPHPHVAAYQQGEPRLLRSGRHGGVPSNVSLPVLKETLWRLARSSSPSLKPS